MRLSNYESCKREPDLATLKRIVESYGVSADWLIGVTDERSGLSHPATSETTTPKEEPNPATIADLLRRVEALERGGVHTPPRKRR